MHLSGYCFILVLKKEAESFNPNQRSSLRLGNIFKIYKYYKSWNSKILFFLFHDTV